MSKSSKTLIAAAITALFAVPAAGAVDDAFYSTTNTASAKFSGSGCKTANINKQNATLDVETFFYEGGGDNTGAFDFEMYVFGDSVDGFGPLISSNKGRTLNMDLTGLGHFELSTAFGLYIDGALPNNDGCKNVADGGYNEDMVITKFETKLNKKGTKAKLKMDAEATYENDKGKDKKVKLKVKANMDKVADD